MTSSKIIQDKLPQKYRQFHDVFRLLDFDELPPYRVYDHRIKLIPGHRLEPLPTSSFTEQETELIRYYICGLVSRGLITSSKAVAASGIYFESAGAHTVPKVSFRQLNASTVRASFEHPIPLNIIRSIMNTQVYTKLVIQNVHEQIRLNINDAHRTTFSTPFGKHRLTTLPFGLVDATVTIQEMADDIIDSNTRDYVVAYQDNILVYSWNAAHHTRHVKHILNCFRDYSVQLDIGKCEFDVTEIIFLGYKLGNGDFTINPVKCKEISEILLPKSKGELKSFIGKVRYWAEFIPDYASKVSSLSNLTLS
ncbi:hypothetical protein DSO57_1039616 [Entomophthora muscae]|uniref:Uncharacterized protein n=1 Tax=Entomophthora muscae TaxID=34485 RepID=A0ACC2TDK2_9FUNG|nr:hypothetical protein DSO57_1039616 [Entomophthora muscae]